MAIISMVNFTTTRAGLTGQLLAAALHHEKPELEQRKSDLLKSEEDSKIEISKLEDFLLEQLGSSSGNLLENKELLASLNETKSKSASIKESLAESTTLQNNLEKEGNVYLPLAEFASQMFFTVTDLAKLNDMYRLSLSAFIGLYNKSLREADGSASASERRIASLRQTLQAKVYNYISRSLFRQDRLAFAMHFSYGMQPQVFSDSSSWDFFVGAHSAAETVSAASVPGWIEDDRRVAVARLAVAFPKLLGTAQLEDANMWSTFASSEECENEFPVQVSKTLTPFHHLLIVQALRPDRLVSAMESFAVSTLALKELSPPALSLKTVFRETQAAEPVLILIASGSDPSEELRELALAQNQTLHEVSMGQGQNQLAMERLQDTAGIGCASRTST
jgi:dynein heavy chain 2